ncbi:MAG: nuclear transport factor 2 family protein [Acidobacteriota bacterium]
MKAPNFVATALAVGLLGCASSRPEAVSGTRDAALAVAESGRLGTQADDAEALRAAVGRFLAALRTYSPEAMRASAGELYAGDAYFNDQIKELRGAVAIREYLARSAEALVEPVIRDEQVLIDDGHVVIRWSMSFRTEREPDRPPTVARGASHLIFDRQGKVSFHEDFWDVTAAVWERIPVVGAVIRRVKGAF